jgi:hypothetical protein
MESIAKLIADTAGGTDGLVNVTMGMTVNPVIDTAGCYIVSKFEGEGSIDATSLKVW